MAIEKTILIDVNSKDAEKSIDSLDKGLTGLDKSADKGAKGIGGVSKAFKGLGVAIKAAGIGLVIGALAKLSEIFMQNQKVANLFNTAFEAVSIAFNDFVNFIVNNGGAVVDFFKAIFENPLESIKALGRSIKANITERFESLLDTLGFLASAVKKVFSGDFKGALEDVKAAGKESIDVLTGVNNTVDKASEFVEKTANAVKNYAIETVKAAKANVELSRTAEIGIAQNRLLLEQFDRQAELQRQIRDDESRTIEERIAANQRLGELLAEQEKLMLANADAVVLAAQAQFDKLKNDENEIALLEAKAEREGVLAQITGLRSEQLVNTNSLEREKADIIQENLDKEKEAAEEQLALSKAVSEAKFNDAKNTFNQMASLAGKDSKVGKALALASATISGIEGVQNAYSTAQKSPITTFFPAYPIVQAGLAAAVSAKNIAEIRKINPSGSGGSSTPSISGGATSQPPSFNIVGASDTSQLAEAVAGQEQQPVQAYVVANDVTSAQSLENNIVEGATLQ